MPARSRKLTQDHTKAHNRQLVLRLIHQSGQISRADIARDTGLTPTTVSGIVADLMHDGLVGELGYGPSAGGKPPLLLGLNHGARQVLCLDLGDAEFRGALADLSGDFVYRTRQPRHGATGDAALELLQRVLQELLAVASAPVLGIGIGVPGQVNARSGVVRHSVSLGWQGLLLSDLVQLRYDLPAYVANDSHLASLAEYSFGSAADAESLVLIKVGQGVGSGIILDGHLHYGDSFSAGEIGHVVVSQDGRACTCGHRGCLEAEVSVPGLLRQAQQLVGSQGPSNPSWPEVCALAESNPALAQLLAQAGRHIGISVANLVGILDIQHIVLAGDITAAGPRLLDAVRQEATRRVLETMAGATHVRYSTLGQDIVLLGATAAVLSQELGLA